jgi:amino acid permease
MTNAQFIGLGRIRFCVVSTLVCLILCISFNFILQILFRYEMVNRSSNSKRRPFVTAFYSTFYLICALLCSSLLAIFRSIYGRLLNCTELFTTTVSPPPIHPQGKFTPVI